MANHSKRDARYAETALTLREAANTRELPTVFRCSVCGVEMSATVRILHVSAGLKAGFYCEAHLPAEWR